MELLSLKVRRRRWCRGGCQVQSRAACACCVEWLRVGKCAGATRPWESCCRASVGDGQRGTRSDVLAFVYMSCRGQNTPKWGINRSEWGHAQLQTGSGWLNPFNQRLTALSSMDAAMVGGQPDNLRPGPTPHILHGPVWCLLPCFDSRHRTPLLKQHEACPLLPSWARRTGGNHSCRTRPKQHQNPRSHWRSQVVQQSPLLKFVYPDQNCICSLKTPHFFPPRSPDDRRSVV